MLLVLYSVIVKLFQSYALRKAKIVHNFGLFECNRVNMS